MSYEVFPYPGLFDTPERWYLGSPKDAEGASLNPRLFTEGKRYEGKRPLYIPIKRGSEPIDFTLGAFDMPVVKEEVAALIETFAPNHVQRVKVVVGNAGSCYEALNIVRVVKAVDENLSEISWRMRSDPSGRSTRSYAGIGRLVLDRASITDAKIFRLKDWELPLIVSEGVKDALENNHTTGIAFKEIGVSP
jgi:hypothetical protein